MSSLTLHIEARSFARKMIDVQVIGRDVGQIYDGGGVYCCGDRDGFAYLFFSGAGGQRLLEVAFDSTLALGN